MSATPWGIVDMFVRSFKAKMALFSVCTSGLVFIAFALLLLKVSEQAAYDP